MSDDCDWTCLLNLDSSPVESLLLDAQRNQGQEQQRSWRDLGRTHYLVGSKLQ